MDDDVDKKLEQIDKKLSRILENSYLSRLDLMFSVLLSLTFFIAGWMFNNFRLESNFYAPLALTPFPVLGYTLVGMAHSILKDNAVKRLGYWLALPFAAFILFPIYLVVIFITVLGSYASLFLVFFGLIIPLALIPILERYTHILQNFLSRFPTRFPDPQKAFHVEVKNIFKPLFYDLILSVCTFLFLLIITVKILH